MSGGDLFIDRDVAGLDTTSMDDPNLLEKLANLSENIDAIKLYEPYP